MASEKLVLNELLAFVQNELGIVDDNVIFEVCLQNFDEDEIILARNVLYESLNMETYNMQSGLVDRHGETSLQNIIDCMRDTESNSMPTFVARGWRKLPTVSINREVVKHVLSDISILKKEVAKLKNDYILQTNRRCCCIHSVAAEVVEEASPPLTPTPGLSGFAAALKAGLPRVTKAASVAKPASQSEAKPPTVAVPPNNSMPSDDITSSEEPMASGEPMASAETMQRAEPMPPRVTVMTVKSELHFVSEPPALPAPGEVNILIILHMPENIGANLFATVTTMIGTTTEITPATVILPSIALGFEGEVPGRRAGPPADEEANDSMDRPYAGSSYYYDDDISADIENRLIETPRSKKVAARKAKKSRNAKGKKNVAFNEPNTSRPRRRYQ